MKIPSPVGEEQNRKRKAHKKSRRGCRNCKLRSVKCDETKPQCKRCVSFRVTCNYNSNAPDLQLHFDETTEALKSASKPLFAVGKETPRKLAPDQQQLPFHGAVVQTSQNSAMPIYRKFHGLNQTPTPPYPLVSDEISTLQLDGPLLDRLFRFHNRTVLTIGTPAMARLYQRETSSLSFSHPFLMHVIQTVTAIHDRYLLGYPASGHLVVEICYHWSQAAALLNQKLSSPVLPGDRDAIWACAAMLSIIAFSSVEAETPEEAWPLKVSERADLDWLRMSHGKKAIWKISDPLRKDSIFHPLTHEFTKANMFSPEYGFKFPGIPPAFLKLYGIDDSSTKDNNPYHQAVHTVLPLMYVDCTQANVVNFMTFIGSINPVFEMLLQKKDPRALLLLAIWFAQVLDSQWWMIRRAKIECQAICLYLERYHADEKEIHELLWFAKVQCGLVEYGTTAFCGEIYKKGAWFNVKKQQVLTG